MMKMMRLVELHLPVDNSGNSVTEKIVRVSKIGLRVLCWAVALLWVTLWLLYPTSPGSVFKQDVSTHVVSSFFGTSGTSPWILVFSIQASRSIPCNIPL